MTKYIKILWGFVLLGSSLNSSAKILIFTYVFNRPDFIELQYKTFKKFFEDEYDFVVFSDAKTEDMHQQIMAMCSKYSIPCCRIPQEIHTRPYLPRKNAGADFSNKQNASVRNCNVVQYSLDRIGFNHDDILVLIDSDIFPVKPFNIRDFMHGYDVAGELVPCNQGYPRHACQEKHPGVEPFGYLWIGLVFLDMRTMPNKKTINFNCGRVFGKVEVDAGGFTVHYLQNNPGVRVKPFLRKTLEDLICADCSNAEKPAPPCTHNTDLLREFGLNDDTIQFSQQMTLVGNYLSKFGRPCEYLVDGTFLHYRGGTNYQNMPAEYHKEKSALFSAYFEKLLQ